MTVPRVVRAIARSTRRGASLRAIERGRSWVSFQVAGYRIARPRRPVPRRFGLLQGTRRGLVP